MDTSVRCCAMPSSRVKLMAATVGVVALVGACSGSASKAAPNPTTPTTSPAPSKTQTYPLDSTLRLNQIQVLGSHNSYHGQPYPQVLAALEKVNTATAASLDYSHRPIAQQFPLGVRQLELDVWSDPKGGKY